MIDDDGNDDKTDHDSASNKGTSIAVVNVKTMLNKEEEDDDNHIHTRFYCK